MWGGSRKRNFSRLCKWRIMLKRILMLDIHIILPKKTNFNIIRAIWNLAFVIMSTRENKRLIARASSSADNLWKQLWSRSGPTSCRVWTGFKLFCILVASLKNNSFEVAFNLWKQFGSSSGPTGFNHTMPNGISYPYHSDKSVSVLSHAG